VEKKIELEAELMKEAKSQARRRSLKTAVSEHVEFDEQLQDAFTELDALVSQDKGARIKIGGETKRLSAKELASFVEQEKAKETIKFQSVKASTQTVEFLKEAARRTYESVLTGSGKPKEAFATEEAKKYLPKFTSLDEPSLRQKIGVGLGKGLATVTGVPLIKDEIRRGRAEREAIAIVKGASLGFFAPEFEPMSPEESFLRAAGTQAGIQFIVAPLASKVITTASDIIPKVKEKLMKLPFVTKSKETVTVLEPIKKDITYDVTFQELSGVRTGTERTAAGTAFAFESSDEVAAGIADRTKIFRIKTGIEGKSQIIEIGKESALGKITYVGEHQYKLPSPAAYRIFTETGRFPTEFPIVEISKVATFGKLPSELLAEGGDDIVKFISGQSLTPEKGLDIFFELTKPIKGKGVKGARDLLSLISPEVRGKTYDVSFGKLAGSPFEDTSLALKQISEKVSLVTQTPLETVISLPKLSAGAATAPVISFATRTVPLEFTSTKGVKLLSRTL